MKTKSFSAVAVTFLLLAAAPCMAATLSDNLIAYWTFDDASGTTVTDSKGEANGTINGGVSWSTGADAKFGSGLNFDGNYGSCVSLPTTGTLCSPGNAISFSVWLKGTEAVDSITTSYRSVFNSNAGQDYYILYYDKSAAQLRMKVTSSNNAITRAGIASADIPVNTWFHIGGVYNGTNTILYLNGTQKVSLTGAAGALKVPQFHAIGAKGSGSDQNWKGAMDDFAVWNRALSSDEMMYIATIGKPVKDVVARNAAEDWQLLQ